MDLQQIPTSKAYRKPFIKKKSKTYDVNTANMFVSLKYS